MSEKIPEIYKRHSDFCSVFTNPRRLMVLKSLFDGEKSVGVIARELDMADHAVSQHLRVMKDRGAVRSRKDGRTVYYRITNPKFIKACRLIRDALIEEYEKVNLNTEESG